MQFGYMYCYCVKFAFCYILTLPIRVVAYLYLGIRYDQPMSNWWALVYVYERIALTVSRAIACGASKEELEKLNDEINEILERS